MGRVGRCVARGAALLACAGVSFLVTAPSAYAAIALSDRSPAPGTTVTTTSLNLGLTATDAVYTFDPANIYSELFLDGSAIATTRQNLGHWEDDGCDTWWVLDSDKTLILSAYLSPADGPHTLLGRVQNSAGETAQDSWTFTMAAPPVASQFSPTSAITNLQPTISARVTDNGGTPNVAMWLDGARVPATFTSGIVRYTPGSPLADNQNHTVRLDMSDAGGNTSTASWTFFVQSHPVATFSGRVPAPGSSVAVDRPQIAVTADSAFDLVRTSGKMYLDGVLAAATITQPTTNVKQVNYVLYPAALTDGVHTVRVTVTDTLGNLSEDTWSFTVGVPPTLSSPSPPTGTTVNVARPEVAVTVSDNSPGPVTVKFWFDGAKVFDASVPLGVSRWQPPSDLASNSLHTVRAEATDATGNTRSLEWTFQVVARLPMAPPACAECHIGFPDAHPLDDCIACHGSSCEGSGCHVGHGGEYITDCGTCHNPVSQPTLPGHTDRQTRSLHASSTTGCFDAGCHLTSLIDEHGRYPRDSAFKNQCVLCHASPDAGVQAAIDAGRTDCAACHGASAGDHTGIHDVSLDPSCAGCHDPDVSAQHGDQCAKCHESADAAVIGAISSGDLSCAACHASAGGSHSAFHDSGLAPSCTSCHDANISAEHGGVCGTCHDSTEAQVIAAISGGDLACTACHGQSVLDHKAGHAVAFPEPDCTDCHDSNLLDVHSALASASPASRTSASSLRTGGIAPTAGMTIAAEEDYCAACHECTDPDVIAAIEAGDTTCTACHTIEHTWRVQTWGIEEYYTWESIGKDASVLSEVGANPTNPGVHGNYLANTAKCGICHSVHRANPNGVHLLNTADATCAGCHAAGTGVVTTRLVTTQPGTPHHLDQVGGCAERACHATSPHGADSATYKVFKAKLIRPEADAAVDVALADPASGITLADVNAEASSTWDANTRRIVVAGYTCNSEGCHMQSMLPVLAKGYAEEREDLYPVESSLALMTGHLGSAEATATHSSYSAVESCTSCHDQTDDATYSGFTFPHSETPYGASNLGAGRAYLWMGYAAKKGDALTAVGSGDKAFDGTCLKCHRDSNGTSGIGLDR